MHSMHALTPCSAHAVAAHVEAVSRLCITVGSEIRFYNLETGVVEKTLTGHCSGIRPLLLLNDGKHGAFYLYVW